MASIEYLPNKDAEAALPLLMLESALVKAAKDESYCLPYLQKKCVTALFLPMMDGAVRVSRDEKRS